jgi:citrate lyase beta subunit
MLEQWLESAVSQVSALAVIPSIQVTERRFHTFYGGAHLFKETTFSRMTQLGQQGFERFFATPKALGDWYDLVFHVPADNVKIEGALRQGSVGFSEADLTQLHTLLKACISRQFLEDYRIDFEDGYGVHEPTEELAQAERSAKVLAQVLASAPSLEALPNVGIRLKPFSGGQAAHSVRLLGHFFETLQANVSLEKLPSFWVTLPKCRMAAEGVKLAQLLESLEVALGLASNTFGMELMFETLEGIQALGNRDFVQHWLPEVADGCCQRPTALVLGTFDTCAEWGIASRNQGHQHPLMDYVRLQALGWGNQIGAQVVDSITRTVPQLSMDGEPLAVHGRHVAHSLALGVSAGWDIHPLQVLARHAVRLAMVFSGLSAALERLERFLTARTHASRVGAGFDDLATVRGLVLQLEQAERLGLVSVQQIIAQGVQWPVKV